ncbi:MAG: AI-2E family transporter [Candidatus Eremiobacteraeota bacterium]|nr:AI-2E family transporter [Candidatus Eremiobacteraeota bacterium]
MQGTVSNAAVWRRVGWIVAIVVALWLLWWFSVHIPKTIAIFVIAAFIAFGVHPIVTSLARRMLRPLAISLVYLGLLVSIVVVTLLVLPALLAQISILANNTPTYIGVVQDWIDALQSMLRERLGHQFIPAGYGDLRALVATKLTASLSTSLASLTSILVDTFTATFIGIASIVLSAFFVVRGEHVADSFYELLPAHRRKTARALADELAEMFSAYVSGQVALCAITGSLIYAISAFTGFKFALLLGILSGFAYAIPFVGQVFAHAVATLLAAPQGGSMVLWVNVIVFSVGRASDYLLVPKIMSESVGVSPIVVMFAVFAGGELFGVPGLLLGIPAAALVKIGWRFFRGGSFTAPSRREAPASNPEPKLREA